MPQKPERHYALSPWAEIQPSDLEPQGEPETVISYRHEEHYGLHIRGTFGITLGMLGIRCKRAGSTLLPESLAIADTPIVVDTSLSRIQSNPRRAYDRDEDDESFRNI